jgi:mycothiol synthase
MGGVVAAESLTAAQLADALALLHVADDADGAGPLSEHGLLALAEPGGTHLLAHGADGTLVGYAFVDPDGSAELCVHPLHRRRGLGRALVRAALDATPGDLRLWAHGDHPSANALALSFGLVRERVLWQLRRSLGADLAEPELPAGVTLRTFRPGADDDAWLRVNARAFTRLPDQGGWTARDLHARLAQPWFDPAGFLVAERDGTMLGFHWTKVHSGRETGGQGLRQTIGEVYVLGVDPAAHGSGLGRALTLAGLRHLRDGGLDQVMLYVDGANTAAIRLYEHLGFARWATHACFHHSR